jgi:alpha-glucosidase
MYVDNQTMNILGKRKDGSLRDELIVRVYADDTASSFTLYEDDGETIAYQKGEVRTTLISQQQNGDSVTVTIGGAVGTYSGAPTSRDNLIKLILQAPENIGAVLLNGEKLAQYSTQAEFEAAASGWYIAGSHLILAKSGRSDILADKTFEFQSFQ